MDNSDIVDRQAVAQVRAITLVESRRVVIGAAAIGLLAGLVVAALVYWITGTPAKAVFMLVAFVLIGLWQAIHWWRHYRSIFKQLDDLDRRVSSGEVVYGSQTRFHSYR